MKKTSSACANEGMKMIPLNGDLFDFNKEFFRISFQDPVDKLKVFRCSKTARAKYLSANFENNMEGFFAREGSLASSTSFLKKSPSMAKAMRRRCLCEGEVLLFEIFVNGTHLTTEHCSIQDQRKCEMIAGEVTARSEVGFFEFVGEVGIDLSVKDLSAKIIAGE